MGDCPEDVVVPVILLPGIMGSRLQSGSDGIVWDPDSTRLMLNLYGRNAGTVVGPDAFRIRARRVVRAAARRRKALLVGSTFSRSCLTPVEYAEVEGLTSTQRDRNWSSVSLNTYGHILRQIESAFPVRLTTAIRRVNPKSNLVSMPTYALGYNWSQSNHHSGAAAASKIKAWVAAAWEEAEEIGAQCPGAILVTHSAGGFVARAACPSHGAASDVLAVFSTVMPTDGAPAAYKRFHFGFENSGWGFSRASIEGMVGYVVLGRQGALVTALLGHMPGAQELLPNTRYVTNGGNRRWLQILIPERNFIGRQISGSETYEDLPDSNPYTEIYRRGDRMWPAANPEWLYPEGMTGDAADAFSAFQPHSQTAEAWHRKVVSDGDFHELTHLCHSNDARMATFDHINWRPSMTGGSLGRSVDEDDVSLELEDTPDYRREHLRTGVEEDKHISGPLLGADRSMDPADAAGDRTVPVSSGRYASAIARGRRTGHNPGYQHEAAIRGDTVTDWVRERMVEVLGNCGLY